MRKSLRRLLLITFTLMLGVLSCGDPTDNAEDCTTNEYFNEAEALCLTCQAITVPECSAGCGFIIVNDENLCPMAQCDDSCAQCPDGQSWSDDALSCQPLACGENQYMDDASGKCLTCAQTSVCDGCMCDNVEQSVDNNGCMITTCSLCTKALDEMHTIEDGQCLRVDL